MASAIGEATAFRSSKLRSAHVFLWRLSAMRPMDTVISSIKGACSWIEAIPRMPTCAV